MNQRRGTKSTPSPQALRFDDLTAQSRQTATATAGILALPTRDRLLWAVLVGVKVVGLMMDLAVGLATVLTGLVDPGDRAFWRPSRAS